MSSSTKILLVEHNPDDIELILDQLKNAEISFIPEIVQHETAYTAAIKNFVPDIILSDYSLPSFDGPRALEIRETIAPGIPFLFVSGSIGEEKSIEYIRNGVTDYVLKDKLFTLGVKVKRALKEAKEQKERSRTAKALGLSESQLARAQQVAHLGSWQLNFNDNELRLSAEGARIFGFTQGENTLSYESWSSLVHPDDIDAVLQTLEQSRYTLTDTAYHHRILLKDGTVKHIYSESKFEFDENGKAVGLYGTMQDITERKKSEAAIKEAYEEKDTVLERIDDGFFATDKNSIVTYWNKRAEILLDTKKEDVIGKNLHEVFAATASGVFYHQYQKAIRENSTVRFEEFSVRTNRWFAVSAFGSANGLSVYFKDVTERKKAEQQLIVNEHQLDVIYNTVADIIFMLNVEENGRYKFISVNNTFLKATGLTAGQVIGAYAGNIIPPASWQIAEAKYQEAIKIKNTIQWEEVSEYPTGVKAGLVSITPVYNEEGQCIRLVGSVHDITERKKAEINLAQSEKQYRQIVETAQEGIWLIDENHKTTFVNNKMCEILEYTGAEMVGKEIYYFMDEEGKQIAEEVRKKNKQEHTGQDIKKYMSKTGKEIWANISTNPMFYEDGTYHGSLAMVTDITERLKTEESNKFKATLLNTVGQAVIATSMDGIVNFWNKAAEDTFGWTSEEAIGKNIMDLTTSEQSKEQGEEIMEKLSLGHSWSGEFIVKRKDGSNFPIFVSNAPIYDQHQQLAGIIGVSSDITERKTSETNLALSEKKYRQIVETAQEGIWMIDENNKAIFVNKKMCELLEYTEAEMMGRTNLSFKDEAEQENALQQIKRRKQGLMEIHEATYITKSGRIICTQVSTNPLLDEDGTYKGALAMVTDITEKKKSEQELITQEKRSRALVENGADAVVIISAEGKLTYASPTVEKLLGYTDAEIFKLDMFSFIHPDDVEPITKLWELVLANPGLTIAGHTARMLHKNGSWRWIEATVTNMLHDTALNGIVDNFRDVTEKRELENLLNKTNSMARIGSWEVDLIKGSLYWSDITKEIHETGDDFIPDLQTAINFYKEGESRNLIAQKVQAAIEMGLAFDTELQIITAKENEKWVRVIGETEFVNDKAAKISGSFQDITDHKLAEIQLNELNENIKKHAKELAISNAELEQFAYVASHDLQEPLRMVTSFLTQLEKKYGDIIDAKGKMYIDFAVDGAKRMRQIILDLLEFSRVGRTEDSMENIDLNELIQEIQILFRKKIEEKNAQIIVDLLPQIYANKTPMRQVFQNLISNALKYSREKEPSKIHITVKDLQTHWQFAASDNGIGIAAEYFDKIFIIFQRLHNKDEFSGTGMGLAVTKKIIESMGGKIHVESVEGKGSTFFFTIKK